MKLLVFVLNREELLDEVLSAYVEAGIAGATVLDSEGMGRYLTYEVPLFADFKEFMKGNKPYNKTIFSVVTNEEAIPHLKKLLDRITGGLDQPGTGILFTLPVDFAAGLVDQPDQPDSAAVGPDQVIQSDKPNQAELADTTGRPDRTENEEADK